MRRQRLIAMILIVWAGSYAMLRTSSLLVRTNYVARDKSGVVVDDHTWVQVNGRTKSLESWVAAIVFVPLWQLEFRLRRVYH